MPTASTPFCNVTTIVPGPMSGASCAAEPLGVVELHGEEHHVGRPELARVVAGPHAREVRVALGARQPQPVATEGVEMRATRHERDIAPRLRQPPAEVAADASRSEHDDLHDNLTGRGWGLGTRARAHAFARRAAADARALLVGFGSYPA